MLLLAGCGPGRVDAPSVPELANASYSGIFEEPLTLVEGKWEGEPFVAGGASRPTAGLVDGFHLTGDLNQDGAEEAVVLLWSSSGGSGTFDYIAIMGYGPEGEVLSLATVPLGDRVQLRSANLLEGRVELDLVQAGAEDAACCPGQKVKNVIVLGEEGQVDITTEDQGRLSLDDLAGNWALTRFSRDEPVSQDFEFTLQFDGKRVGGKAACNVYTARVGKGEGPGEISLARASLMTRMICPTEYMAAEKRYLKTLQMVTSFSFQAGKLMMHWRQGEDAGALVFSSYEAGSE
jgi:heat shock protein HslJ